MASVCEICAKGELSGNNVSALWLRVRSSVLTSAPVACVLVRFSVLFNLCA